MLQILRDYTCFFCTDLLSQNAVKKQYFYAFEVLCHKTIQFSFEKVLFKYILSLAVCRTSWTLQASHWVSYHTRVKSLLEVVETHN